MNNKKTTVVSGRIPNELRQKMVDEGLTVRQAVELAIATRTNPTKYYEAELRSLLSERDILTNRLLQIEDEITEIKEKANIKASNDELKEVYFQNDNDKAIKNTLDYYCQWSYQKDVSIHDFIDLKSDVIDRYRTTTNLSKEEFYLLLIEQEDKSKQVTLD